VSIREIRVSFFTFATDDKQSFHIEDLFADFVGDYGFSNQAQLCPFDRAIRSSDMSSRKHDFKKTNHTRAPLCATLFGLCLFC